METNGYSTEEKQKFRSSYLNCLASEFYKAETRNRLHEETLKLAEKNYAGEMLAKVTAEEKRQYESHAATILQHIDTLAKQEQDRLDSRKKNGVTGTEELDVITRIDKIADIVSREELQIMADAYKDSPLVQRKLCKVAERRGLYINTYPDYDKKTETALQAAADIKSFIYSRDFGLAPAVYIRMQMGEADDILVPVEKEVAEDDNT